MPIVPNILEHTIFFTLNQGPAPILDLFSAIGFRVVVAAIKLGVFDALDKSGHTVKSLAAELGTHPEGTRLLLDSLEALGYVRRQGDQYTNTAMTRKWLVSSSQTNFAPFCMFWNTMLTEMMTNL